jgi:hypothetical protein
MEGQKRVGRGLKGGSEARRQTISKRSARKEKYMSKHPEVNSKFSCSQN